jgi:ABC-type sulfate transport system substrate-binding protein
VDFAPSLRDSECVLGAAFPTLKGGANMRCAYGAGVAWSEDLDGIRDIPSSQKRETQGTCVIFGRVFDMGTRATRHTIPSSFLGDVI